MFYNAGCMDAEYKRIPTKKALKEALKADPSKVWLDGTSAFKDVRGYWAHEIPEGLTVSVVGPNPYERRNWYASVKRVNGAVKVS